MTMTAVALDTTMGTITIELYTTHAPRTCANFAALSRRAYYDNVKVHRVIKDFIIQTGDPKGDGTGGTITSSEPTTDPPSAALRHTGAGVVSMADGGNDSGGGSSSSQFFITLAPTPWLDGHHTIFGRVRDGLGVVRRIGLVDTDDHDRPRVDVRIIRARPLRDDDDDDDGGGGRVRGRGGVGDAVSPVALPT